MTLHFIDSHAHLDGEVFDADRAEVLSRARAAGVREMIQIGVGTDLKTIERAVEMARTQEWLHVSIGVHPHDVSVLDESWWPRLRELAESPEVCAVGETGLDYFYDHSPHELQVEAFIAFIELAEAVSKPVICHIRDAHDDAKQIFREAMPSSGVVIHCFTGTAADARDYVELGCHVSFSGIATFKNAGEIRRAIAEVPIDRLLVETDCPYLAPVPHRGKRNEPSFLIHTAEVVAAEVGVSVAELAMKTTENTRQLFALTTV